MPPDRLAAALELIAEISPPGAGTALHSILKRAQELGDTAAVRRFQAAIILASPQVCEAAACG